MKIIRGSELEYRPAGHENPLTPGVWKKVLFAKTAIQAGNIQMINWSRLPAGSQFAAHYHEDMQEIFVMIEGTSELKVDGQMYVLSPGDAAAIEPREVHQMCNRTDQDVMFLAMGIASGEGGQSVVVGN